jgi:antitoxin YefM
MPEHELLHKNVRIYVQRICKFKAYREIKMKTATITDFRQKMKEHLDEIRKAQDILVLTGPKKKDFVVLTLETFNAMEETAHLLSTSANTKRLMESIAQDKAAKTTIRELKLDGTKPKNRIRKTSKKKGSR